MFSKPKEGKTISALCIGGYIHSEKDKKLTAGQIALLREFVGHVYRGTLDQLFTLGEIINFYPKLADKEAGLLQRAELVKAMFLGGRYGNYIEGHYVPNEDEIARLITILEGVEQDKLLGTQLQFGM